jgi:hypothetical protein
VAEPSAPIPAAAESEPTRDPTPPPQPPSEHSTSLENNVVDLEPIPIVDVPAPTAEDVAAIPPPHSVPLSEHELQKELANAEVLAKQLEASDAEGTAEPVSIPADEQGETLPPAPVDVVAHGNTPGPEVALASSESAALAVAQSQKEAEGGQEVEVPAQTGEQGKESPKLCK